MSKETLKQKIDETIYENLEGDISGENLNEILNDIVDEMPEANPEGEATAGNLTKLKVGDKIYTIPDIKGLAYGGIVIPSTSFIPDTNSYYIADGAGTYTAFDDVVVYSSDHVQILTYDGTEWQVTDLPWYDYTYAHGKFDLLADFGGATASTNGTTGLVPAPKIADKDKFLKGDGTWSNAAGGGISPGMSFDQKLQAQANLNDTTPNTPFDGKMGYVVLQPEKAGDATTTFAAQIADKPNTIFEIRDVYDLDNATVTIPEGCILRFNGGMLKNGKLNMQSSTVEAANVKIFDSVTPYSTSASGCRIEWNLRWFGMSPKVTASENTAAISAAFNIALEQGGDVSVYLPEGSYIMNGFSFRPSISCAITFRGDGRTKSILKLSNTDTTSLFLLDLSISTSYIRDIGLSGNTKNWEGASHVFTNPNPKLIALFTCRGYANSITRCGFNGSAGHGVWLSGNNALYFNDCVFSYNLYFGAFVLFNRGVHFNRPYAEFNGMGSIIHTQPYYLSNYAGNNRMIVKGGMAENVGKGGGGTYGVRGTALNYKDEPFEYTNSFVRLESVSADYVDDDREYNTNTGTDSINIVIKPLKYKKTTLAQDTTIEFKDNQWNDFIVYKRDDTYDITFDKDFLAGDEIYLFDYQQNIKGEYTWEEVIDTSGSDWFSLIKSTYQNSAIIVDQEHCGKNYETIGVTKKISGIEYSQPTLVDFQETNWCDFIKTLPAGTSYKNPIFINAGISTGALYNPTLQGARYLSDASDCFLYVFGQCYQAIRFRYRVESGSDWGDMTPWYNFIPKGNFCIEVRLGDMRDLYGVQIHLSSDSYVHLGYGMVISSKRFPKLNGGIPYQGTFANKPAFASNKIGIGYPYFCTDKQTTEGATNGIMIYHKGNDVWVDALGRTIS